MAARAQNRIKKELKKIMANPPQGLTVEVKDDLWNWTALLAGPTGSPYEGGVFKVKVKFPASYPMKCPQLTFETKIFHPNVSSAGEICADALEAGSWAPTIRTVTVLQKIQEILANPNGDNPLDPEVGVLYNTNKSKFVSTAKAWTRKYAS